MTTMEEKHKETHLAPTADETEAASELTSTATSLKLAPEEDEKRNSSTDVPIAEEATATAPQDNADNYFHGMQLMPVFVAILLSVFLIAIDQVRFPTPASCWVIS